MTYVIIYVGTVVDYQSCSGTKLYLITTFKCQPLARIAPGGSTASRTKSARVYLFWLVQMQ
eukprot:1872824-Amphidinium_carterae.1